MNGTRFLSQSPEVTLVSTFARSFDGVVAAARTCYSPRGIVTIEDVGADRVTDEAEKERRRERRNALAKNIYLAGHHTTYQHAHFQFALRNVSRQFVWSFLHAHPYYNSEQTSQRYVEVKPDAFAVPPLAPAAERVYRETCSLQMAAYQRLMELLHPEAARAFFATFRGRERQEERWFSAIQKKAQEIARYVLPVATFTTLYHTISAVTLFRYFRLCEALDAPLEQTITVRAMVDQVLRVEPGFGLIIEEPLPLSETPEFAAFELLEDLFRRPGRRPAFREEFDRSLNGRVSCLIDRKNKNEEIVAQAVREVLGLERSGLSDDDALALVLDPSQNTLLGETLNLTTHSKLSRALHHASYTFRKKLSHTADSQDQRHRTTPASRPTLLAYLSEEPDYITPQLIRESPAATRVYRETMERTWENIRALSRLGVKDEFRVYLLPNAVAIRLTESADLSGLRHKLAMRLCFNAQEEIWQASVDEALQIREIEPRIGKWLLPPCGLRARAGAKPICPEGSRFCGVVVWKQDVSGYRRRL